MNLSRRGFLRALGITSAVIALPTLWLPEGAGAIVTTSWATLPQFVVCGDLNDPKVRDAVLGRIRSGLLPKGIRI